MKLDRKSDKDARVPTDTLKVLCSAVEEKVQVFKLFYGKVKVTLVGCFAVEIATVYLSAHQRPRQ